jgi:hypothetical protein
MNYSDFIVKDMLIKNYEWRRAISLEPGDVIKDMALVISVRSCRAHLDCTVLVYLFGSEVITLHAVNESRYACMVRES